jgi:nicotinamidase-related amidase
VGYEVKPDSSALLVIDVQEEYFDPLGPAYFAEAPARLASINRLIEAFAASQAPVIYIRHAHRPSGTDVGRMADFAADGEEDSFLEGTPRVAFHHQLSIEKNPIVVTKTRYDSF